MERKIHVVRKPFLARKGQFCENETLAIGVDYKALEHADKYRFKINAEDTVIYSCDAQEAVRFAYKHHSFWENKAKKLIAILPLFFFKKNQDPQLTLF